MAEHISNFIDSYFWFVTAGVLLVLYGLVVVIVRTLVRYTDGENQSYWTFRKMTAPIWWFQDAYWFVKDQTHGRIERRHANLKRFKEWFEGREPSATGQPVVDQRLTILAEEFRRACLAQENARHMRPGFPLPVVYTVSDANAEVDRAKKNFWAAHEIASVYPQFTMKMKVEDYYRPPIGQS